MLILKPTRKALRKCGANEIIGIELKNQGEICRLLFEGDLECIISVASEPQRPEQPWSHQLLEQTSGMDRH